MATKRKAEVEQSTEGAKKGKAVQVPARMNIKLTAFGNFTWCPYTQSFCVSTQKFSGWIADQSLWIEPGLFSQSGGLHITKRRGDIVPYLRSDRTDDPRYRVFYPFGQLFDQKKQTFKHDSLEQLPQSFKLSALIIPKTEKPWGDTLFEAKVDYQEIKVFSDSVCPICTDDTTNEKFITPCGHIFHTSCLIKTAQHKGCLSDELCECTKHFTVIQDLPCPICKTPLKLSY
jgi:hypothetical protein